MQIYLLGSLPILLYLIQIILGIHLDSVYKVLDLAHLKPSWRDGCVRLLFIVLLLIFQGIENVLYENIVLTLPSQQMITTAKPYLYVVILLPIGFLYITLYILQRWFTGKGNRLYLMAMFIPLVYIVYTSIVFNHTDLATVILYIIFLLPILGICVLGVYHRKLWQGSR